MFVRIALFFISLLALTVSDSRAQSQYIPDSIMFCDEVVPLDDADVRERLETQLLILSNQRVQVTLWFQRKNRFFPFIETTIEKRKQPVDLKYIPVIESSLITRARSRSDALGLWQFMEPTGKAKGLNIADDLDERLHFEKATIAALDYLDELHSEFGSWFLSLAAYNAGPGRIREELYNQGTSNYFEMILPDETERYVFNAIAAKLIFEQPEKYGFQLSDIIPFKSRESREIDIRLVNFVPVKILAYCAGTHYRGFRQLNPWITGVNLPKGAYSLKIPISSTATFNQKLADYFDRLKGYINYHSGKRMTVTAEIGKMHIGPHGDYPVFRELPKGTTFKVNGRTNRLDNGHYWYIFKQTKGSSGWIWGGEISE
ncbi:transglycosylase SLT domain-containing protein [bacterium]|nr:transglycosylase SLT domain-containing protein [candidate division CSSED10-310 bacterium]